jgi:hypothetical protein
MADLYWIGVFLGLGLGIGVILAGFLAGSRAGAVIAIALAAAVGFALGLFLGDDETEAVAAALGGIVGAASAVELVRGALRRGGPRLATALLVAGGGFALIAFALIPVVGYLELVALPLLAIRMRRQQPERYAGLRTLARD